MSRNTSSVQIKSRLDQEFENDEGAQAAAAEAQALPQATNAPRKAKKTTSDVLAAQLLQVLSESQATSQQILQDKLDITTLVQGWGRPKLMHQN